MTLPTIVQGQRYDGLEITWYIGSGTATKRDLTGATLTGAIRTKGGDARAITGTLTPDADQVANKGVFTWAFSAADTEDASEGQKVQFFADFGTGLLAKTFPVELKIEPDISTSI